MADEAQRDLEGVKPLSASDLGVVQLAGQQLAFYRALAERDAALAAWYLGARVVLMTPANPERLVHAAHSVRELMDNLHKISNVPVQAKVGGGLGDAFAVMTDKWEKAKRTSRAYGVDGWSGEIDAPAQRGFAAVDAAIAWQKENRPKRKEQHRTTLRGIDVSPRALPAFIEDRLIELWDDMRDYFVYVCHHGRETSEEDFLATLDQLEKFVLDRLNPRTFSEQATIDLLIAEAERGP